MRQRECTDSQRTWLDMSTSYEKMVMNKWVGGKKILRVASHWGWIKGWWILEQVGGGVTKGQS